MFWQKLLAFVKAYWYAPLLIAGIIFVFYSRSAYGKLLDMFKNAQERHKKEIKDIVREYEEDQRRREEALKLYQKRLNEIQFQYDEAKKELEDNKKKQIEKLLKENPDDLAQKLADLTGFKVII